MDQDNRRRPSQWDDNEDSPKRRRRQLEDYSPFDDYDSYENYDRQRDRRPIAPRDRGEKPQSSQPEKKAVTPKETEKKPVARKKKAVAKKKRMSPWTYLLLVFCVSGILATLCWTAANDVLALHKKEASAVITVEDGDSYSSIVAQLKDNGLIESKFLFNIFSFITDGESSVTAGTYELNTEMDYRALISGMGASSDSRMTTIVTIPEGYTIDQIFQLLEDKGVSTVEKLQETAATHNYNFSFLLDFELGDYHRLEGYLFPDTYQFYMGESSLYVINKMLVNFDDKVTDSMREMIWDKGYTISDVVIIASLIEKETDGTDRELIASVIYNRLNNPSASTAGYLNIDAAIAYVLPEGETVTASHYESVDSPYNTYLYKGLPPTAIANPGLESIVAAMNPASTNYYYYALGDDGLHYFFATYDEHLAFLGS